MAEQTQATEDKTPVVEEKTFNPITTQEEFDKVTASIRHKEQGKYKDFDQFKKDSEELAALKEKDKTALEKATKRADDAEKALAAAQLERQQAAWVAAASKATGVPVEAIHGDTEEAINSCAESLKGYFKTASAPVVKGDGNQAHTPAKGGDWMREAFEK